MSYPASQFYNAGFFNITEINNLTLKPDILFFEWSTTDEMEFHEDKLYYFLNQLLKNNILPIFLILGRKNTYSYNRISDDQLYKLNVDYKIPLLDLRYLLIKNSNEILRDVVHTSESGAILYASKIMEFINNTINKNSPIIYLNDINIPKSGFYDIKKFDINRSININEILNLTFKNKSITSEVVASITRGPYTPIIEYISDGIIINEHSFFDPWCYFERESFDTLVTKETFNLISSSAINLRISEKNPDYSITKTSEIFNVPKQLKINSIYTNGIDDFKWLIT
jgi:hypothetical protein